MKHYDSIPRIQDDGTLKGDTVWGYNKLDGQNFCVVYKPKTDKFGPFGSRTVTVDERSEQLGDAVRYFLNKGYEDILSIKVAQNSKKGDVFNGIEEIVFFFEWYGENSFAGKHQEGDEMHLALIDVFLKKKGYIEPKEYEKIFRDTSIEIPELIYKGQKLYEQKPAWSEEDEEKFSFIRAILIDAKSPNNCASNSTYYREVTESIEWLKSLKEKVNIKTE